jgi:hypothetical protein
VDVNPLFLTQSAQRPAAGRRVDLAATTSDTHSLSLPWRFHASSMATTESTEVTENPDPPARVHVFFAPSAPLRENSFEERACRKTPVLPFSTVVKRRVR